MPFQVQAQEASYTLRIARLPLHEALEQLVSLTRLDLMYDPALVDGRYAVCFAQAQPAETLLRCVLEDTGLDFYRLSSGTYVLTPKAATKPQFGHLVGLVLDAVTGEPLPYAHVLLAEARTGIAATQDGRFTLGPLLPGRYRLHATYLGYSDKEFYVNVPPEGVTHVQVMLQARPISVKPVVVDGLTRQFPERLLGREEVEIANDRNGLPGLNDVQQAVMALPGVHVGGILAEVHVQGGDAGAHQFRLDDAPIFIPLDIAGMVGPFSPFAIRRVTAHKAGFGTALGSHLSGVIAAEHEVGDRTSPHLDFQADPLAFNGRLTWRTGDEEGVLAQGMFAARSDLGGTLQPPALTSLLQTLVEPDTFLVRQFPEELQRSYEGRSFYLASQNPALHFSDLHMATRLHLPGPQSLYISFFHGQKSLSANLIATPFAGEPSVGLPSSRDYYTWTNEIEQARYERVMHPRLLASLQVRRSRYELRHRIHEVARFDAAPTTEDDGNRITEQAIALRLDYSFSRLLHGSFGYDAARTTLRFFLGGDFNLPLLHNRTSDRIATFLTFRFAPTPYTTLEAGTRLTHLFTVHPGVFFAEPRAEIRQSIPSSLFGGFALRASGGLYRQYLNQFDLSSLQASPLRPALRFWLPVDGTVQPSKSYHVAGDLLWLPGSGWEIGIEGYHKWQPHELVFNYKVLQPVGAQGPLPVNADQVLFLESAYGRAYGGGLSLKKNFPQGHVAARYEYSFAARNSNSRFRGRWEPVPWNEPHRVELSGVLTPTPRLVLQARGYGVWNRPWGFAKVYYDYLEYTQHVFNPFIIGKPEQHRLPPLLQLDLAASYTLPIANGHLQFRADVLNATNRRNVAYWQLRSRSSPVNTGPATKEHETVPQYLLPMMPTFSLRIAW